MHIITISGSASGVGKTTLARLLIAGLPGFAAIKVTNTGSDVYTSVTDDPATIDEPGKDTALMKAAGAHPVVWVRCGQRDMGDCLTYAFNLIGTPRGVIVEGNSPARMLKPDMAFFVTGTDLSDMKPGALDVLKRADVVVVNVETPELPVGAEEKIRATNPASVITTMGRMRLSDGPLAGLFKRFAAGTLL
jgi:hypothetical protein